MVDQAKPVDVLGIPRQPSQAPAVAVSDHLQVAALDEQALHDPTGAQQGLGPIELDEHLLHGAGGQLNARRPDHWIEPLPATAQAADGDALAKVGVERALKVVKQPSSKPAEALQRRHRYGKHSHVSGEWVGQPTAQKWRGAQRPHRAASCRTTTSNWLGP